MSKDADVGSFLDKPVFSWWSIYGSYAAGSLVASLSDWPKSDLISWAIMIGGAAALGVASGIVASRRTRATLKA